MAQLQAVIFDLDGVIVNTDEYHYQGWQRLCDEIGIPFDRKKNEKLRGVDRMRCLKIVLPENHGYSEKEQEALATRKNDYYKELIKQISPADLLPGLETLLASLDSHNIKKAVASASKNAMAVMESLDIVSRFDVIVTGYDYKKGKPAPDIFLSASARLGVDPQNCIVIEDAVAGVEAGKAAGMRVVGLGNVEGLQKADKSVKSLTDISYQDLVELVKS